MPESKKLKDAMRSLAKEWEGIARELANDESYLPMVVLQIRAREIQLCRWHAKQVRAAIRKMAKKVRF